MLTTVRRVLPHEYNKYRDHLKALDAESKLLRFGHPITDMVIDQLCDKWDTEHDKHVLFCIENEQLEFVAMGHVALESTMELAFSVLSDYRGQGMGNKLMLRCMQYCRTHGILHGYMMCLPHNAPIKHLCIKNGIHMHTEYGETTADIELDAPNVSTYFNEAAAANWGAIDYMTKRTPWSLSAKYLTGNTE